MRTPPSCRYSRKHVVASADDCQVGVPVFPEAGFDHRLQSFDDHLAARDQLVRALNFLIDGFRPVPMLAILSKERSGLVAVDNNSLRFHRSIPV